MISLHILDVRGFMAQLLLRDTFDRFYLTEASVTTFGTFLLTAACRRTITPPKSWSMRIFPSPGPTGSRCGLFVWNSSKEKRPR